MLSGAVTLHRADLLQHIEPLETGAATTRDLARIGTALARHAAAGDGARGPRDDARRPLVVVHDREASRVPWEVLRVGDYASRAGRGPQSSLRERHALRGALARRLRRSRDPLRVLLIVDPTLRPAGRGGRRRGAATAARRASAVTLDVLAGREATRARIVAALGTGAFDVLHFAGHAFFDARDPRNRAACVCAGREVLRGGDLASLGNLPALVFCNACEAARVRKRTSDESVACAPVRHAPHDDGHRRGLPRRAGSPTFSARTGRSATTRRSRSRSRLYGSLLTGDRLGDAVLAARRRLESIPTVDWADYVHYGSPAFRLCNPQGKSSG